MSAVFTLLAGFVGQTSPSLFTCDHVSLSLALAPPIVLTGAKMSKATSMVYVPLAQRYTGFQKPTIAVGFCTPRRCLAMLAASLVVTTVIIQSLYSFRHAFSDMHLRTDVDGELVVVSPAIANKYNARCLDGKSLPGYYLKQGIDEGEDRWLIVFPHNDWCTSVDECTSRMSTPLEGTMDGAPVTFQFSGILSSDPAENAYFADWNMVRLISCDGGTFLGNSSAVLPDSSAVMKMQGAAIISAVIDHLIYTTNIRHSKELTLYGERSGSVSALAYTRYIKRRLPFTHKLTTILHSGLLFDVELSSPLQSFFDLHNIQGNFLLSECAAASCLDAVNLLLRPRTSPVLIYTSSMPQWPLQILYKCDSDKSNACNQTIYHRHLLNLHGDNEKQIKRLSTVITRCDWPFRTTPSNGDPEIGGRSLYQLLSELLLAHTGENVLHIEQGNCTSPRHRSVYRVTTTS